MKKVLVFLLIISLFGCTTQPDPDTVTDLTVTIKNEIPTAQVFEPIQNQQQTDTPLPTQCSRPSRTPTKTIDIKATSSCEAEIVTTAIRTITAMALTPTLESSLKSDKSAGTWIVGIEIASGSWKSSGNCYAMTYDQAGNQLSYVWGLQATIWVDSDAFSVEFVSYPDKCNWTFQDD